MSRKLRYIRRLEHHLKRHPKDEVAKRILDALKNNKYEWRGRKLIIKTSTQ